MRCFAIVAIDCNRDAIERKSYRLQRFELLLVNGACFSLRWRACNRATDKMRFLPLY